MRSKARRTGRGVFVKALAVGEPTRRGRGVALKVVAYFGWPESSVPEVVRKKIRR